MTFIQPWMLLALPLIALPVIIHLINQRRYQTMRWAAMMFLLAANRMSRGYARLRQWLILLFRMAVVAALIFAVSRPLASGWFGVALGGRPDTTIILLDRSPSMQAKAPGSAASKLETATAQLAATLANLGSSRWILIDSVSCKPSELESPAALTNTPAAAGASASADIPAMLQAAYDYIAANHPGRTEIWICSDLRGNDWNSQTSRWQTLRDAFLELKQGIRIHLLSYARPTEGNLSIRVTSVRRQATSDAAELLLSLRLTRDGAAEDKISVPVTVDLGGARSEIAVEMTSAQYELKDHPIALTKDNKRGWGHVSIPADSNPADNDFYFAYEEPAARQTIIVAEDPRAVRAQQVAAEVADDPTAESRVDIVAEGDLGSVEWEKVALVMWEAALPQDESADRLKSFLDRGGQVIFFPPANPDDSKFTGVSWGAWESAPDEISVETWRGDQDLLAHTQSGAGLPVGDLHVRRHCSLTGEFSPLATLHGGAPLLTRVTSDHGGIYFCATTTAPGDSSLASDGVVLYAFVQRALAAGSAVLGSTRQITAGESASELSDPWAQLAGDPHALSTDYPSQAGAYSVGERTVAVNRSAAEDESAVLADAKLDELFRGLDFIKVNADVGGASSLAHEVWRIFLCAMMIAMVMEAVLCLPKRPTVGGST